jgi:hypothetical protein
MSSMTALTGQFVILHHTGHGAEHWDFMLEESGVLATWWCPSNPASLSPDQSLLCKKLPDHRLAYLTYEGPVSRDRGQVRRVEEGEYECISTSDHHRRVRMHGRTLTGLVELRQEQPDDGWSLKRRIDTLHTSSPR